MSGPSSSPRLSRTRRIALYVVGIGVWLSGVLWLAFHYFVVERGPFGSTESPMEPCSVTLHGAFAFAAIWLFGLLWGAHLPAGWSCGWRRRSGGLLAGLWGWLIVSGYLLYYAGGEEFRTAVSLAHWITGLTAPAAFAAHRLKRRAAAAVRSSASARRSLPRAVIAGED